MDASERLIDILQQLGACLSSREETPHAWRPLGEALLAVPGVSGVWFALWREEHLETLSLGELPGEGQARVDLLRAWHWDYRADGAPMASVLATPGPLVIVPLGEPDHLAGALALATHEPVAPLMRLAEVVASGLRADLRRRRLAGEMEQARTLLCEQIAGISELPAVSQLAASVAHELRNPLSSIKGAAQYIRNEYQDHATVREFLDIIIEEVGVLNRITTEFLDFARPMHLNLEQMHVHDSIRRLLQVMKPQMAAQGIEAVLELSPEVPPTHFDSRQVDQMLRNIVMNAIQAMPDGGTLSVRTRAFDTPLPGVEIAIADTGRGINPEDLHRLFTPFFTTKTKGVGLGLTIVQRIAQNHGGVVSVQCPPGGGSEFTIRLPCAPGAESLRVSG
jgi:signal transduction histidine kinase